jgi:cation diffusion facilitator CzcD-associated flavoprotein CzcO
VIGTAASAVQFVPQIAPVVQQLDVYQRTANWIRPREDSYTPEQLARFRDEDGAAEAERAGIYGWINAIQTLDDPQILAASRAVCLQNLALVEDLETRRALTPDHPFGAKRALVSNDWYPTFNRPNVRLVSTPIAAVESGGIRTVDGALRAADTIILATGFDTTRFLAAIPVAGRDGTRLDDAWSDGAQAYLGITVSGFPNLFMLYGPNTNNGSIIFQIECQVEYLLRHLARMQREGLRWIDVKHDVMVDWNRELQAALARVAVWQGGTNDYYRAPSGRIVTQWPHGMDDYRDATSQPDEAAYDTG